MSTITTITITEHPEGYTEETRAVGRPRKEKNRRKKKEPTEQDLSARAYLSRAMKGGREGKDLSKIMKTYHLIRKGLLEEADAEVYFKDPEEITEETPEKVTEERKVIEEIPEETPEKKKALRLEANSYLSEAMKGVGPKDRSKIMKKYWRIRKGVDFEEEDSSDSDTSVCGTDNLFM